MSSQEYSAKDKSEPNIREDQKEKEPQHGTDCPAPIKSAGVTPIRQPLPEVLNSNQNGEKTTLKAHMFSPTEPKGSTGAKTINSTQTDEHLNRQMALLTLQDSNSSADYALYELPLRVDKTKSGPLNPFKKLNHSFRLDTHKTYRDSLVRPYGKSNHLDTRSRRRLCNSKAASIFPSTVGSHLPASNLRHPTIFISKLETPLVANARGIWNLRKSLMVKKLSAKGLADINQKSNPLPPAESMDIDVTVPNNILPLNCFEESNFTEGLSYQEVVSMNSQQNKETDTVVENPVRITNTHPFSDDCIKTEESVDEDWFRLARYRVHLETKRSMLDSKPSSTSAEIESNLEQPKQALNVLGECSSMDRITDWDPWAGLKRMGKVVPIHVLSSTQSDNEPMDTQEVGKNITIIHSTPAVPVWPILKGPKIPTAMPPTACEEKRGSPLQQAGDAGPRSSRSDKRVQWSQDVQVIYFAGDSDGGSVVGTEIEPLREEADQQSRAKQYAREYTRKFFSRAHQLPLIDPWFPGFRFNK